MKRKGYRLERATGLILQHWLKKADAAEEEEYARMLEETGATDGRKELDEVFSAVGTRNMKAERRCKEAYEAFYQATHRQVRKKTMWGWWAAAVALLMGVGSMFLMQEQPQGMPVPEYEIAAQAKAYLTLSDGSVVDVTAPKQDGRLEREGVVACDSGMLAYDAAERYEEELVIYNTISVPRGGDFRLVLSDGTEVTVNAESSLRYPVKFGGDKREVYVTGEAYFKVARDESRPFSVCTSKGVVEVLGTEFNVRDYEDEKRVETTLAEGAVLYRSNPEGNKCETIYLKPGLQVVDDGVKLVRRKVNVENVVSWKDGKYVFYDKTLEELMVYVARTYDVEVFFVNESVKELRFSGDLQRYDRVGLFLTYLEQSGDVRFTVQGRTITVYKK